MLALVQSRNLHAAQGRRADCRGEVLMFTTSWNGMHGETDHLGVLLGTIEERNRRAD